MDKIILKKIAKDWSKSILLATAMDCEQLDDVLTEEEQDYIVKEVHKVALRITKDSPESTLVSIVKKYYEIE